MRDALTIDGVLARDARRFDFFQALRLIEQAHAERPRLGRSLSARDDAVRLSQDPELIFHPTTLGDYAPGEDGKPGRLAVNFLGLLGPNGPLPTHLTAYVRERARNANDPTLARFLDVFHHRMLSLFYRAWADAQPVVSADRPRDDRFAGYVGSLFGLGAPALADRDAVPDSAKRHFAGVLAAPTRHADGLRLILARFFGVNVSIEPWRGHWIALPEDARTRLCGARLGISTVVGTRVWDCQHKFRIVIGPLGYVDFMRFLPGGASLTKLADWVRNYVRDPLDWDVALHLKREEVPPLRLQGHSTKGARLGWNTWLTSGAPVHDNHRVVIAGQAQANQKQARSKETSHD
ncbi:type VI secretion system baseplate subunit TssG [Caballeronia sp. NK8]|uniref:type VI secretion system baseplate subunit TssG n=1 Tax=Caballeronia sp. NK8 TaxID=140098 RepID=UPI001BB7BEB5|nr:type VI secretion system baseplate subunit TssG [Caballeronia sp. NK8]BCQ26372.1 type VI secretion system baseplate subunit TssG [Caballeronia sp. NK8]